MKTATIKELVKSMEEEAIKTGKSESAQITVNGTGIQDQYDKARDFPVTIFYLLYEYDDDRLKESFVMHKGLYNREGNEVS